MRTTRQRVPYSFAVAQVFERNFHRTSEQSIFGATPAEFQEWLWSPPALEAFDRAFSPSLPIDAADYH